MVEINLLDPHAIDDPHGYFRQFRDGGPIQWSDRHRAWIVMGHLNSCSISRPSLSTERMSGFRERLSGPRAEALSMAIDLLDGWMLFRPPEHTRLRGPSLDHLLHVQWARWKIECSRSSMTFSTRWRRPLMVIWSSCSPIRFQLRLLPNCFGVPIDEPIGLPTRSEKFGVVVFGAVGRGDYDEVARAAGAELEGRLQPLFDRYR